jgi:hypothetical protein
MRCPQCKSQSVTRSHRRGLKEKVLLRLVSQAPYKCGACNHRFLDTKPYSTKPKKNTQKYLVVATILLAIFAAVAIVEWTNQASTPIPDAAPTGP